MTDCRITATEGPQYPTKSPNRVQEYIQSGQYGRNGLLNYSTKVTHFLRKFGDMKRDRDLSYRTSYFTRSILGRGTELIAVLEPGNLITFYSGAFACCFSNSGLYLAIACIGLKTHPIKVYDVLTSERVATLEGHQDLVYQLNWSSDDS